MSSSNGINNTSEDSNHTTCSSTLKGDSGSDHQSLSKSSPISMDRFDPKSITSTWLEGTKKDLENSQKVLIEMKQTVKDFEIWLESGIIEFGRIQENVLRERLTIVEDLENQQIQHHQALETAVGQMVAIEALMHSNH